MFVLLQDKQISKETISRVEFINKQTIFLAKDKAHIQTSKCIFFDDKFNLDVITMYFPQGINLDFTPKLYKNCLYTFGQHINMYVNSKCVYKTKMMFSGECELDELKAVNDGAALCHVDDSHKSIWLFVWCLCQQWIIDSPIKVWICMAVGGWCYPVDIYSTHCSFWCSLRLCNAVMLILQLHSLDPHCTMETLGGL